MALKNKKELLGIITEECAEVIQAISKINRFGLKGYHPDDPEKTTNIESLEEEVGDLIAVLEIFKSDEDVNTSHVIKSTSGKLDKLSEFSSVLDEPEEEESIIDIFDRAIEASDAFGESIREITDENQPNHQTISDIFKPFRDAVVKNLEEQTQKHK